jgi:TatD family-associated radical SAM protein
MDHVGESDSLWLEREPSAQEVIAEFDKWDVEQYEEIVFCGFGEPTQALDVLVEVAAYIKKKWNKPIRINTNGLGNLIHGKNIVPMLVGLVDTVSISLNDPDPVKYQELVRSKFGEKSFKGMLDFAKECAKLLPKVVMTTVDTTISKEEEKRCQQICDELGATYRIRPWEDA